MPSVKNPPNRFSPLEIDWCEPPPPAKIEVIEDHTVGALSRNDSPDIPFTWSVNPYRGCTHACAYCYARPTHEYLGFGAGTDFERKISVKMKIPTLLEEAFNKPSWQGEAVCFSGVTDCYQPLERRYELTRRALEVAARYRNPVQIITRSPLITRDLDLLLALHEHQAVSVTISIPILDAETARALEPGAPPPAARLRAMAALTERGIPTGVSLGPLIPGINDASIPETLRAAREAGATWTFTQLVRLPGAAAEVFEERLHEALPLRADAVMARLRRARGGDLSDTRFFERMRGQGEAMRSTLQLFDLWKARLGYGSPPPSPSPSPFRRPGQGRQLGLFGAR